MTSDFVLQYIYIYICIIYFIYRRIYIIIYILYTACICTNIIYTHTYLCVYNINHLTYEQYHAVQTTDYITANCNAVYNVKGN